MEGSWFLLRLEIHTICMRFTLQSAAPSEKKTNVCPVGSHYLGYDCTQKEVALKIRGLGIEWDILVQGKGR